MHNDPHRAGRSAMTEATTRKRTAIHEVHNTPQFLCSHTRAKVPGTQQPSCWWWPQPCHAENERRNDERTEHDPPPSLDPSAAYGYVHASRHATPPNARDSHASPSLPPDWRSHRTRIAVSSSSPLLPDWHARSFEGDPDAWVWATLPISSRPHMECTPLHADCMSS